MNIQESQSPDRELELSAQVFSHPVAVISLLESISQFELMGVSWMMALRFQNWSHETHEHAYDEVRHTKIVTDCARKLRWQLGAEDLILENKLNKIFVLATEKYLQSLSKRIFKITFHRRECDRQFAVSSYALISFLIERRIMKIYPALGKLSVHSEVQELAKTIIADERAHLTLVTGKLPEGLDFAESSQNQIILMEKDLANTWIQTINDAFHEHVLKIL